MGVYISGDLSTIYDTGYTGFGVRPALLFQSLNPAVDFACEHSYVSAVTAPTCTEKGCTTHTCSKCGDSYKDSYTDALGHVDSDKNNVCDNCGADLGKKDPSANCSCKCHKTKGIQKFFWKIINFFNKIFKKNQLCDCGAKHW